MLAEYGFKFVCRIGIPDDEMVADMRATGFTAPAMTSISFGMYNDVAEVDTFLRSWPRRIIGIARDAPLASFRKVYRA